MPTTLQQFLVRAIPKAADDLMAAFLRLPEEERGNSPGGKARSPVDQIAECAILNGSTCKLLETHTFGSDFQIEQFQQMKDDLAGDWTRLKAMFEENTAKVVKTIAAVPDGDLAIEVQMPWGNLTIEQIVSYPYWN